MELYKEKEECEVIELTIDPEKGVYVEAENIDFSVFEISTNPNESKKVQAFKETHSKHKHTNCFSELEEMNVFKNIGEEAYDSDALSTAIYSPIDDIEEDLISIDELLQYLDTGEEFVDV